MRRQLYLALALLLAAAGVYAQSDGLLGGPPLVEDEFLPVDAAFVLQAPRQEGATLEVSWGIAPGYYMYRHALRFRLPEASGIDLGPAQIPQGEKKHDEYFGEIEAYRRQLNVQLPLLAKDGLPSALKLEVRYQGCADKGLCYPPQTRVVEIQLDASASPGAPLVPEHEQLATLVASGGLWVIVPQFLFLGLLLAFTPCVLPMLPILSGVIAGEHASGAWRGFTLSLVYVLAMAAAYTVFGVVAGLFGQNLQAAMQAPAVLIGFSLVFVALALSMFGLFKLQLPNALQSRFAALSARQQGGKHLGAAVMGFLSALIVGPCIAPPLAGALLYIGQSGDPWLGGTALFALGLGMGLPLVALGTFEASLLPRAGAWMTRVNHGFGFLLLGVAIWLLGRLLPPLVTLTLWAALAYAITLYLLTLRPQARGALWANRLAVLFAASYGAVLAGGALLGGTDPLRPLAALSGTQQTEQAARFKRIKSAQDLTAALAASEAQPALLDFYADWCVYCKEMERTVFPEPEVEALMSRFTLLQADVTANDAQDRELLQTLGVIGPPTLLFFAPDGRERAEFRMVGELNAEEFAAHLQAVLAR